MEGRGRERRGRVRAGCRKAKGEPGLESKEGLAHCVTVNHGGDCTVVSSSLLAASLVGAVLDREMEPWVGSTLLHVPWSPATFSEGTWGHDLCEEAPRGWGSVRPCQIPRLHRGTCCLNLSACLFSTLKRTAVFNVTHIGVNPLICLIAIVTVVFAITPGSEGVALPTWMEDSGRIALQPREPRRFSVCASTQCPLTVPRA